MGCLCPPHHDQQVYVQHTRVLQDGQKYPSPSREHLKNNQSSASKVPLHQQSQGQRFKQEGNRLFKAKKYYEAIIQYQTAVYCSHPSITYYTNLALAYKANNQLEEAINTIEQMQDNPNFQHQKKSQIYQKGQLIKARCMMIQIKEYCMGKEFNLQDNKLNKKKICKAIEMLQNMQGSIDKTQFLITAKKLKQFLIEEIIFKTDSQKLLIYLVSRLQESQQFDFKDKNSKIVEYYASSNNLYSDIEEVVDKLKVEGLRQEQDFMQDPITWVLIDFIKVNIDQPDDSTIWDNLQSIDSDTTFQKQRLQRSNYSLIISHRLKSTFSQLCHQQFNQPKKKSYNSG